MLLEQPAAWLARGASEAAVGCWGYVSAPSCTGGNGLGGATGLSWVVLCWRCRRLQSQVDAAAAKLEQQSAAAARSVAEECERHVTVERALQQQVQQLTSELAVAQVGCFCVSCTRAGAVGLAFSMTIPGMHKWFLVHTPTVREQLASVCGCCNWVQMPLYMPA